MKILEKRPLALILCIMLGGFSFFINFTWQFKLILATVPLLIIGIIFLFDTLKCGRNVITIISLAALSVSILLSSLWSVTFYPTSHYNSKTDIKARIYDIDHSEYSSSKIICETEEIAGKKDRHTFILYTDREISAQLRKYDVISFNAQIQELSNKDDGFDGKSYYVSKGYSGIISDLTDLEIHGNKVDHLDSFFGDLRLKISNVLKLRTNFETGAFLSALIVGDRSDLSGNTKLNFARLGISHILALSGMHLAILSFALNFLLTKIGFKKKVRVTVMACTVAFYIALTGFSASVLRSGFMLIITSILFLLSRKTDVLTSLLISVFIIVLINPTSVFDNSLWLSAFATLGVIVYAEIAEKTDKNDKLVVRLWVTFKNGCLVSVFAFAATFAFTALRFDNFSIVSVFTTLIFSFVIQFFIYGGLILLLIGGFIPFGKLMVIFSDAIVMLAEFISSLKFIYVSMNSLAVKILVVLLTVSFFAFLILEIKNKKRGIIALLILLLSTFTVAEVHTLIHRFDDGITYLPSTSGDITLTRSDGDISAIYSGKAFADDSFEIIDGFADQNLTFIDNFVFTSYSYSTVDFAEEILNGIKISKILLPRPTTADEIGLAESLSYLLSGYGAKMEFYESLTYVTLGEYKYRLFQKNDYTYGEYPENVYEIVYGDERFTYLSVCEYDLLSPSSYHVMNNTENLFIGSIGNTNYYIFDKRLPDIRNIYYYDEGRLTPEAQEYYEKIGASTHCVKTPVVIVD